MNKNTAKKSTGLRFTLSAKITIMFGIIIIIMLIPMLSLMISSNNFMNRYVQVLSNVNKIDSIKTITDAQPQRILNNCIINTDISTSGEGEKIAQMLQYISDIKYAIGNDEAYAKNLEQAAVVENLLQNYLQNYREGIGLCDGSFSLAGDSKFYTMNDIAGYISKNCSTLLNLEMQRTADIQQAITSSYNRMRINVFVTFLIIILVAIGLVALLKKGIAKPIRLLSKKLAVIAEKDLTDATVTIHSKDEVGDLAHVFNSMSNNLKDIIKNVSSVSTELEYSFQEVTQNIEDTAKGSEHISKTVDFMLEKIEKQNDESRMVMSNIENISDISEKIHNNAENILLSARNSINDANQGTRKLEDYTVQLAAVNTVIQEITQMVKDLGASAQRMNDIVNTISEISDETNLLSLNASIEAARAGEAGRGFAVVADQIQKLADSSKNSATEIGSIITDVQNRTINMAEEMQQGLIQLEKGNTIAEETRKSFGEIEHSINQVDAQIHDIVSNVKQLSELVSNTSRNMETIECAMHDTSQVTNSISDTVSTETANLQELTATMSVLSDVTAELKKTLEQFKL